MSPDIAQCEILVVGGGLAGSAAATSLARRGCDVVLVERETAPRHKVCGEFLSTEALHLLGALGVFPEVHGAPRIGTVRLASANRVAETRLPFTAQSLTRRCLDGLMLRAAETAGARVLRGTAVESLAPAQGGTGWLATLSDGQQLRSRRTILASGKHDLRGFARPKGTQGDLVALKMYFRLSPEQTSALGSAVELLLHPEGYTGLQLVEGDVANLCGLVRRTRLAHLGGWSGVFNELLRTNSLARLRLASAEPLLAKPLAISSIPYGFVRRRALAETLYAVGDQAAVIPSFTGDGMSLALYTGLASATAILQGESAAQYQHSMHRQLHQQVWRATVLARALVYGPSRAMLVAGARLWPRGIRAAASLTRLSASAVAEAAACTQQGAPPPGNAV